MAKLISPSGREYEWTKDTPPTEEDMKQLQNYDASLGGGEKSNEGINSDQKTTSKTVLEHAFGSAVKGIGALARAAGMNGSSGDNAIDWSQLGVAEDAISEAPGGGVSPSMSQPANREATRSNAAIAGAAASVAAPEALGMVAPAVLPAGAVGPGGYLLRSAGLNAVSGAAGSATDEALKAMSGEDTKGALGRIAGSTAAATLLSPINGPIQKVMQAGAGGVAGLIRGLASKSLSAAVSGAKQGAIAGFVQPLFQTAREAEVQAARSTIQAVTGEEAPQSMGEALGKTAFGKSYVQIERELGPDAKGALSDDDRNKLTKAVLFSAAELAGSGARAEVIADMTVAALKKEIGMVSEPVEEQVKAISKSLVASLQNAEQKASTEAGSAITPQFRMTPTETGENLKTYVGDAQKAWRARQGELFDQYRAEVGDAEVAGLPNAKRAASDLLKSGLKGTDAEGNVVQLQNTLPDAQARQAIDTILQAADTPQSIESLRKFISNFSDNIEFGVLSKIPDANKKALRGALKADMMAGLEALPDSAAKEKLLAANSFTADSIDEMLSKSVTNAGRESGGTSSESVFRSVSSKPSEYNKFISVMGERAPQFRATVKNGILSELTAPSSAAVDIEGRVNATKAFQQMANIPEEIRKDLGIDLEGMRKIAMRQEKVQELLKDATAAQKKDPEAAGAWLTANKDEFQKFLGPGGEKRFEDFVAAKAAQDIAYKNSVLADVSRNETAAIKADPAKFVDAIVTGKFGPAQSEEALALVSRHDPAAYQDVQVEYLSRLLEQSKESGVISGKKLSSLIGNPVGGRSPSSGGSQLGLANSVLGKGKVDDLRFVADKLGTVQDSLLHLISNPNANSNLVGDAVYSVNRSAGMPGSAGLFHNVLTWLPKQRYQFLAGALNDPKLRSIITKPARDLTGNEASELIGAISAAYISK